MPEAGTPSTLAEFELDISMDRGGHAIESHLGPFVHHTPN